MKLNLIKVFVLLLILTVPIFFQNCQKTKIWEGNILIITLDTTRADHLGSYGYKNGSTPNLDKLANDGLRFENCYTSVPLTLPSHSNIFTGKYSIGHGVRNNGRYVLRNSEKTMAEYLGEKGYNTYAVIASFVLQSKFGLAQGFDVYDDSVDNGDINKTFKSENDAKEIYKKFNNWFEDNSGSKFFAWVHFYDPHTPYIPHEKIEEGKEKNLVKLYDGELSYVDKYVGKIVDKLKEKNIYDETLIVIVGDHGEAFGEHEEYASHMVFCYEANLKVPLIFHNKKLIKNSKVVHEKVDTIDIMPTIIDLTGCDGEGDIQGESLESLFYGGNPKKGRSFYIESMYGKEELNWAPLTGIIDGDFKYISLPKSELYNIKKDPLEKDNLFRKKGTLVRELDKKLRKLILKYSAKDGDSKRDLGKEDIEHLKSLGYISSFASGGKKNIDPKDGIVLNVKLKKISSRLDDGDINILEKDLKEILNTDLGKENFIVYDFLSRIYMKKNERNNLMNILKLAMKRLPNAIPFRLNYVLYQFDYKNYSEVIENCNLIIKEDPLFTRAFIILGDTYDLLGEEEKSNINYRKAIDIEPGNISLRIKFAEKLLKAKKFSEVSDLYNDLLQNDNVYENVDLLYKIALFNTKYGSMVKSGEILSRIIDISPKGKYYYYYALILYKLGNRDNAIKNMEIALNRYSSELNKDQISIAEKSLQVWK